MEDKVIDGKKIASEIREELRAELVELANEIKTDPVLRAKELAATPGLAVVLVGDRPDSAVYVRQKIKACKDLGIKSIEHRFGEDVTEDELLQLVEVMNQDDDIHGILVQLPLPQGINSDRVLRAIDYTKDVDGFHPNNMGLLALKSPDAVTSCTPKGCMELLKRTGIELRGKKAVVMGRSNIVGMPVSLLLLHADCTPTVMHRYTDPGDARRIAKEADVLIAAMGKPEMVDSSYIKEGAVVIDVGINAIPDASKKSGQRLVGDVNYAEAMQIASKVTPVPGGVGAMTIAMLMSNTIVCFRRALERHKNPEFDRKFPSMVESSMSKVQANMFDSVTSNVSEIDQKLQMEIRERKHVEEGLQIEMQKMKEMIARMNGGKGVDGGRR